MSFTDFISHHGKRVNKEELGSIYEEKVYPGTIGAREVGNIYCGSIYFALASLLETVKDYAADEKIGIFSYGSG